MRRIVLLLFLPLMFLLGCGGHHTSKPLPSAQTLSKPACHPAPGQGHLGVCVPHQVGLTRGNLVGLPSNQGLVVDVYEGDAIYSWAQAKPHIVGAIVKAWEYRQDHQFANNWNQLRNLNVWHTAYLFLHSDCFAVDRLVQTVNSAGGFSQANTGPPVIDAETPDTRGSLGCAIARAEQLTHRVPIVYTAPGTYAGGDHKDAFLWAAGYGNYSHCPYVWTGNCIAWQYTDGQYGPYPHQIPGIQPGDISVSYGIQHLVSGPPPPPPDPYAILNHTWWGFKVGKQSDGITLSKAIHLNEVVEVSWTDHLFATHTSNATLAQEWPKLKLLRDRIWSVAHASKDWGTGHRHARWVIINSEMTRIAKAVGLSHLPSRI